jgi:hypothetical protein
MSGFTLLGRLCVCPHGHGSWCNCVPSAGPAHGLSRAGAVCVRGQWSVRASDDTFNKKQPNFPTYMRLDSTATLVHVS